MKKRILIVISCYNPPMGLFNTIENLYNFQLDEKYDYKIICIDNNSSITKAYDKIYQKYPKVLVIFTKKNNYDWGAYKYSLENFNNYHLYFCLKDIVVLNKKIDMSVVEKGFIYTIHNNSGFKFDPIIKSGDISNRLLKGLNFDFSDIYDENFNIVQNNTFVMSRSNLENLFKDLFNPAITEKDNNYYERLFGMYFIKKNYETKSLNNYISISNY